MTMKRLAGMLRLAGAGEGHEALWCGDEIIAEWARDHIGGGDNLHPEVWGNQTNLSVMTAEEADRKTRECRGNRFVSLRYWLADREGGDDAIKQRAIESHYGAAAIEWGARYSEVTGYLWTDEHFVVGGHDMLARLTDAVGKYLLLEVMVHDGPLAGRPASHLIPWCPR